MPPKPHPLPYMRAKRMEAAIEELKDQTQDLIAQSKRLLEETAPMTDMSSSERYPKEIGKAGH